MVKKSSQEEKGMTQQEIQDRIESCPWRERPTGSPYACTRYYGDIVFCDGACSWVADYPKLKELKAQKDNKL